jgi:hypothetical protein
MADQERRADSNVERSLRLLRMGLVVLGIAIYCAALQTGGLHAATVQGSSQLAVQIAPAGEIQANLETAAAPPSSGVNSVTANIQVAVRLNPGTTASLWLYSDSAAPALLLTIGKNGRYATTAQVPSADGSSPSGNVRLVLKSSDRAIQISKNL